jgi:hypothetical protein
LLQEVELKKGRNWAFYSSSSGGAFGNKGIE